MNRITFHADSSCVRTGGRSIFENGVRYLDYTNTFIEFQFRGTYAEAELISDLTPSEDIFRAYFVVIINGDDRNAKRIKVDEEKAVYELWRSDREETVKIRLMKVSEAAFAKLGVASVTIEGELLPVPCPEYERRIEFIGDSITCGYGIDGIWNKDTFSTETENPLKGFAYKTAKKCRAEYQYLSWSGIGVISAWVEETAEKPLTDWLMQDIYPYTDSGLENTLGRTDHENHTKWDFSAYVPQVIIFNIGTNDHSWTKDIKERQEDFERIYYEFIELIREKNPDAYIICTYGIMGTVLCDREAAAVERFKKEHDGKICYIPLPEQEEADGIGADWHPSEISHEKISDIISAKANEIFESMGL